MRRPIDQIQVEIVLQRRRVKTLNGDRAILRGVRRGAANAVPKGPVRPIGDNEYGEGEFVEWWWCS